MGRSWLQLEPHQVAAEMRAAGIQRAWIAWDERSKGPRASTPLLDDLARTLAGDDRDYRRHEAIFFAVEPRSGSLFGAFLHSCLRGQTQGGLRHWHYPSFEAFVRAGLRLSLGMARKSALAGLWRGYPLAIPGRRWDSHTARTLTLRLFLWTSQ